MRCNCEHGEHFDTPRDEGVHPYGAEIAGGELLAQEVGAVCRPCGEGHLAAFVLPPRISRVFDGLGPDHPAVAKPCAVCGRLLEPGDQTALCLPGEPEGGNVPAQVAHARCTRQPDGGERL